MKPLKLFTVLTLGPALLIHRLDGWSRRGASVLALGLVALQLVPSLRLATIFNPVLLRRYQQVREREGKLIRALDDLGIWAVYDDYYWDGAKLTFDTEERIIFARPFSERRAEYRIPRKNNS